MHGMNPFWHPLAKVRENVQLPNGKKDTLMNSWAIASDLSYSIAIDPNNKGAEKMVIKMCQESGVSEEETRGLIKKCRKSNWTAIRRLQALIATGFDEFSRKVVEEDEKGE